MVWTAAGIDIYGSSVMYPTTPPEWDKSEKRSYQDTSGTDVKENPLNILLETFL